MSKPAPDNRGLSGLHFGEVRSTSQTGLREHLDLRPPAPGEFASLLAGRSHGDSAMPDTVSTAFASKRFPEAHGHEPIDDENSPPSLAVGANHARILGRAEAFAQRFHHEGLPIARLWENHSALVSLGLNQKGKPGLWLVQKTH